MQVNELLKEHVAPLPGKYVATGKPGRAEYEEKLCVVADKLSEEEWSSIGSHKKLLRAPGSKDVVDNPKALALLRKTFTPKGTPSVLPPKATVSQVAMLRHKVCGAVV